MVKSLALKKMKKFCFDLDGVICFTKNNDYKRSKPKRNVIKIINNLYEKNFILIYTARYMGRSNENEKLAKKKAYRFTLNQLKKWGLKFDKLKTGKPSLTSLVLGVYTAITGSLAALFSISLFGFMTKRRPTPLSLNMMLIKHFLNGL